MSKWISSLVFVFFALSPLSRPALAQSEPPVPDTEAPAIPVPAPPRPANVAPAKPEPETPTKAKPAEVAGPGMEADPTGEIASLAEELRSLVAESASLKGDAKAVVDEQAGETREQLFKLIDAQASLTAQGKAFAVDMTTRESARLRREIRQLDRELRLSGVAAESSDPEKVWQANHDYIVAQKQTDAAFDQLFANIGRAKKLGLDTRKDESFLDEKLEGRASRLAATIQSASKKVEELGKRRTASDDEKTRLQSQVTQVQDRRSSVIESLDATVKLMKERGLESAKYKQLLIDASGKINENILDREVAAGLAKQYATKAKEWVTSEGPALVVRVILFVLIVFGFRVLGGLMSRLTGRLLKRRAASKLLVDLLGGLVARVILALGIVVGLWQFGISVAPILAGFGIAGLVIGLALQSTLTNVAAGAMILAYKPYDLGDLVKVAGHLGTVKQMNLMATTILTLDAQRLTIPNSTIWGDVVVNVNAEENRRVDMTFGVSYSDDVDRARAILEEILAADDRVLDEPETTVRLDAFGESSIDFAVRPWTKSANYWDVYWDTHSKVKQRFDAEGISIPFPQRDVHLHTVSADQAA